MSSSAGGFDAPLVTAGRMLAERGVYGLVWLDDDLVVAARFGRLVDFVEIGVPVTNSIYALVGLEADLQNLKTRPGDVLELPLVAQVRHGATATADPNVKLTFTGIWSEDDRSLLLLVARSGVQSDVEIELSRQVRARLIAEAQLDAKSRELEAANAELVAANDDLDAYASIISHDLGQPMRAIRHLVDDLEQAISGRCSTEGAVLLAAVRDQSRRMTEMLQALLDYSSVTRKTDLIAPVDTRRLVEAIVASLGVRPRFEVVIEGAWPTIDTVAAPLDLILRNLIGNAAKHHDRGMGRIVVSSRDQGTKLEIRVADDGKGIPAQLSEAAFLPFRKLADGGTDGQGMGLALVKKTVERSGGTIRLERNAAQERGATFVFTWPKLEKSIQSPTILPD
ncbi:MAG: HAMP domain-containing sensor histidine kinase [Hyphomicrobium sp.]|nr:HAMP domain-containing sensor histidine kinase [Hyphomicrobium sp.]